jgi:hypothetical protein
MAAEIGVDEAALRPFSRIAQSGVGDPQLSRMATEPSGFEKPHYRPSSSLNHSPMNHNLKVFRRNFLSFLGGGAFVLS